MIEYVIWIQSENRFIKSYSHYEHHIISYTQNINTAERFSLVVAMQICPPAGNILLVIK
jgi:hypothetical protein